MKYSKNMDGEYIIGVRKSPMDIVTGVEITEADYNAILAVIQGGRQKDERLLDDNGTYRYVVVDGYDDREEPPQDDDIPAEEALDIITGVVE